MTRSLTLPAPPNGYILPQLPGSVPNSLRIASLPSVLAWFNGLRETVSYDPAKRLTKWATRVGLSALVKPPVLYPGAGAPLYVPNAYWDRSAVRFTKANGDVLQWTGQRAIGRVAHTTILIADLKPATFGVQFLIGDSTPTPGQHIMTLDRRSDGTVFLGISAGPNGSVGILKEITPFVNVNRPMLIIASVDGFFNTVKLQVNNIRYDDLNGNPSLQASDVYLGASGFGDSTVGIDMDLYDLILMQDDIFADGRQGHLAGILDYASVAYGIL